MITSITLMLCSFFTINSIDSSEIALPTKITDVTVFLSGAQVTRSGSITVPSGTSTIVLKKLSPHLEEKSIQINSEDIEILSVSKEVSALHSLEESAKQIEIKGQLDSFALKMDLYNGRLRTLDEIRSILKANRFVGDGEATLSLEKLSENLKFQNGELTKIMEEEISIERDINELKKQVSKFEKQLKLSAIADRKLSSEIRISIDQPQAKEVTFTISYLVKEAGWLPKYDIKVDRISEPVNLICRADIYQNTGVDWNDVHLKLSSGNPNMNGHIPSLSKWHLTYPRHTNFNRSTHQITAATTKKVFGVITGTDGDPLIGASVHLTGTSIGTLTEFEGQFELAVLELPAELEISYTGYDVKKIVALQPHLNISLNESPTLDEVVVTGYGIRDGSTLGALSGRAAGISVGSLNKNQANKVVESVVVEQHTTFEFEIEKPHSVPSQAVKRGIKLTSYALNADFKYTTIPKVETATYLQAHVYDWDKYNLLEGEANLFFEETYLGRTVFDTRTFSDTLEISLGQDQNVLVARNKVNEFSQKKMLGPNKINTRSFKIDLRNNKSDPIEVTVIDQLPVPIINQISVDLVESGLAKYNTETGELRWKLTLPPSSTQTVEFSYSVKYPRRELVYLE